MQKKITLNQVKKFLLKKGLIVSEKNKKFFFRNDFKSIYFTALSSLVLILFFYCLPIFFEFKENSIISSIEVTNNSKSNFEKVLDGEVLEKSEKVDQLFKDTNYTLEDVRSTKLVKPIALSLLPEEIKKIESTEKRKNLFIQIILPLVIEENNKIKLDRRKLFSILNKNHNTDLEKNWLNSKFKQYGVLNKDLSTLKVRMDIVPVSLAIAQAAKETGWGTSRFALEGNALFGQWTWSGEGIKPAGADDDATHKVMKFKILKSSVRAYQRNLNTHSSYKQFRMARAELRDNKVKLDSLLLVNYLDKYAETGKEYTKILKKIIQQNSLADFDDVKLLPSSIQLKSLI